jgi:hypothetical protein
MDQFKQWKGNGKQKNQAFQQQRTTKHKQVTEHTGPHSSRTGALQIPLPPPAAAHPIA